MDDPMSLGGVRFLLFSCNSGFLFSFYLSPLVILSVVFFSFSFSLLVSILFTQYVCSQPLSSRVTPYCFKRPISSKFLFFHLINSQFQFTLPTLLSYQPHQHQFFYSKASKLCTGSNPASNIVSGRKKTTEWHVQTEDNYDGDIPNFLPLTFFPLVND